MKGLSVAVLVDPSWKEDEQLSQTNLQFCILCPPHIDNFVFKFSHV